MNLDFWDYKQNVFIVSIYSVLEWILGEWSATISVLFSVNLFCTNYWCRQQIWYPRYLKTAFGIIGLKWQRLKEIFWVLYLFPNTWCTGYYGTSVWNSWSGFRYCLAIILFNDMRETGSVSSKGNNQWWNRS